MIDLPEGVYWTESEHWQNENIVSELMNQLEDCDGEALKWIALRYAELLQVWVAWNVCDHCNRYVGDSNCWCQHDD